MMMSPITSKHAPAIPADIVKKRPSATIPNQTESHIQKQCFRTKMCTFFNEGKCNKGSSCSFAHNTDQLKDKPDFKKTRLCAAHLQRKCVKSAGDCPFAHGESDLRKHRGPPKAFFESKKSSLSKHERSMSDNDGVSTPTTFPRSSSASNYGATDEHLVNHISQREDAWSPMSSSTGLELPGQFLVPSNNIGQFNNRIQPQFNNTHHRINGSTRACDPGQGTRMMPPVVSHGYPMIPMINRQASGMKKQDDGGFTDFTDSPYTIEGHSVSTVPNMSPMNFAASPGFPPLYSSGDPDYYNDMNHGGPFVNSSMFLSPSGLTSSPNMNMTMMHSPMLQSTPNMTAQNMLSPLINGDLNQFNLPHSPGFPCDFHFKQASFDRSNNHTREYEQHQDH